MERSSEQNERRDEYDDYEELRERRDQIAAEIEEYNKEHNRIRTMLGSIGGQRYSKRDMIVNAAFLVAIIGLFGLELITKFMPTYISLEVGVLLVSIKIVWMIHSQHRFNHFQFWVLNSIEYRVNEVQSRVHTIEKTMNKLTTDR